MAKKREPELVLRPTMHDFNREQYETYLEVVRAKRMAATVEHFQTKNRKIELKRGAMADRIDKALEMLHKELVRLEQAEAKVDARLGQIQELMNEHTSMGEDITEVDNG